MLLLFFFHMLLDLLNLFADLYTATSIGVFPWLHDPCQPFSLFLGLHAFLVLLDFHKIILVPLYVKSEGHVIEDIVVMLFAVAFEVIE